MQHNCVMTPDTCVTAACLCAHMFATERETNTWPNQTTDAFVAMLHNPDSAKTLISFNMLTLWPGTRATILSAKAHNNLPTSCWPYATLLLKASCVILANINQITPKPCIVLHFSYRLRMPSTSSWHFFNNTFALSMESPTTPFCILNRGSACCKKTQGIRGNICCHLFLESSQAIHRLYVIKLS